MGDRSILCNDSNEFLIDEGRNALRLSGDAAIAACMAAADNDLTVVRIEGGRWLEPGFEARLDSIWTTTRKACSKSDSLRMNIDAANFIRSQMTRIPGGGVLPVDAFIMTAKRL